MIQLGQLVRPTRQFALGRDFFYDGLADKVGVVTGFPQAGYSGRVEWDDGTVSDGILLAALRPA
jgi:hypothetical protein